MNLSKWYSEKFNKPEKDYMDEANKIDLSMLEIHQLTKFTKSLADEVGSKLYDQQAKLPVDIGDPDFAYLFYFTVLTSSNKKILEALHNSMER